MRLRLNDGSIRSLAVPDGKAQLVVWDTDDTGFGVVIGKNARTFVCEGRVNGKKERKKIGIAGQVREDGHPWNAALARKRARELLGQVAAGVSISPVKTRQSTSGGPTLRMGVDAHLARMRAKNRATRSIQTFEHETGKYLADWLDTPINDVDVEAIQKKIKASVTVRKGSVNQRGAMVANRVIAHVSASWRSLNRAMKGKLGTWNPASSVDKDKYIPSRKRIIDLRDWYARVQTMISPVRRDGLMLALYTGLRHEDVRTIREEHVSFDARTMRLPDPKGGEAKAFTIPLCDTVIEILKRRVRDNAKDIGVEPAGWVFPGIALDGKVGPIANLRQKGSTGDERFPAEDVHTLRRTWESIAHEEGISELDQHVLSNHSFGSHNVNATYIAQHIDHLAACAAKIDAGISRRLGLKVLAKRHVKKARRGSK
jgi:integrase